VPDQSFTSPKEAAGYSRLLQVTSSQKRRKKQSKRVMRRRDDMG
jgi:hypothetical protein